MKNKIYRGFNLNLAVACGNDDLRPVFKFVHFKDGYMFACDAYIAVKAKLKLFTDYDEAEIKLLEGKMFHSSIFKKIYDTSFTKVTELGVEDVINGILYKFDSNNYKVYDLDAVFEDFDKLEKKESKYFGINAAYLTRLSSAMNVFNDSSYQLTFEMKQKSKMIMVSKDKYPKDDLKGLIMPVSVNED